MKTRVDRSYLCCGSEGNHSEKVVPWPGALVTPIRPPRLCMTSRHMARPKPRVLAPLFVGVTFLLAYGIRQLPVSRNIV